MSAPRQPEAHELPKPPEGQRRLSTRPAPDFAALGHPSLPGLNLLHREDEVESGQDDDDGRRRASGPSSTSHPSPPPAPGRDQVDDGQETVLSSSSRQPDSSPGLDAMVSSVATLKPARSPSLKITAADSPTHLTAEASAYVDPTPSTPLASQPPSRSTSNARSQHSDDLSSRSDNEKASTSEDDQDTGSQSEIQSIMDQFSQSGNGPGEDEVMSPRLEIASPMMTSSAQLPPRPLASATVSPATHTPLQDLSTTAATAASASSPSSLRSRDQGPDEAAPPVPPKDGAFGTPPRSKGDRSSAPAVDSPASPPALPLHRPPPPDPEPEPVLPFDFHRFLEQLRNKKADPVARYLKSFLSEFGKRQWMVHEQVKIISDFLAFIANKMTQCEVWMHVSDPEFDNAREGMEKLVMNRLYTQTFSPAISPPQPIPGAKAKRRGGDLPMGPGRRGQHQEDVERDDILTQKINIYGWVREEHLDIPPVGESGRRFLRLAQQELLKIKSYRAPRDKIICVLNCSKVIFGLLKHNKSDSSADSFMPLLIHVVLQSNPEHLVSNVQYILRFRNQEKLGGEAGYYLSSLMGAIQFIENMDRSSLTISDDDFEKNVEAAVSAIAEKHQAASPKVVQPPSILDGSTPQSAAAPLPTRQEADETKPPGPPNPTQPEEGEARDDGPAISGLLRTFQKPLTTIGRIFSDDSDPAPSSAPAPSPGHREPRPGHGRRRSREELSDGAPRPLSRHKLSAEEAAARQASAEEAEAQRLHRTEHANIVDTLAGMFPDLDKEIISDVVYQKEGRVGLAVDACLALST